MSLSKGGERIRCEWQDAKNFSIDSLVTLVRKILKKKHDCTGCRSVSPLSTSISVLEKFYIFFLILFAYFPFRSSQFYSISTKNTVQIHSLCSNRGGLPETCHDKSDSRDKLWGFINLQWIAQFTAIWKLNFQLKNTSGL